MSHSLKTINNYIAAAFDLNLEARLLDESDQDRACARRTVRVFVKSFDVPVCEHDDYLTIDGIQKFVLRPIIDILKKEEGKFKMTREEAVNKLANAKIPHGIGGGYIILDVLEALGLIKFDEPVKTETVAIPCSSGMFNSKVSDVIKALSGLGYGVYRK